MTGGFRYLFTFLVIIAVVFAGFSLWPVLIDTLTGGSTQSALATSATVPPSTAVASLPPIGATLATPSRAPSYTFQEERETPPTERKSWLYAQRAVILRIEPGGIGHRPPTVSHAQLTILKGTRMWPVRTEADWIMVRSPSGLLGYVHTGEVDTSIPYCKRKY